MFSQRQRVEAFKFGPFRLDLVLRQLFYRDEPIQLPSKTFDILRILVTNMGQVVTKEELLGQVWPDKFIEENRLTVRVSGLRKTLGESVKRRYIETVRGDGYRFVAKVQEVFGEYDDLHNETFDSIAVLPLINESGLQRLDYLCEGVTEAIISSLSQIVYLRVKTYNTVFRLKGRAADPQSVGKELGAAVVLAGKFNQVNNSLTFDFEMIDVKDGAHLWGAKYSHRASDLLTLNEVVAREISEKLRIRFYSVGARQDIRRYTDNSQAYSFYMKGRYLRNKNSPDAVKKSVRYLTSALKLDEKFALAYVALANSYLGLGYVNEVPSDTYIPKAKRAIKKALALDDSLAEAYATMGVIEMLSWNWPAARGLFERGIHLNRFDAQTHRRYASYLAVIGHLPDALDEINLALKLDPFSVDINLHAARIYYYARQYEKAVRKLQEVIELDPHFGTAHGLMGIIYIQRKQYERGLKEIKRAVELHKQDPEAVALLGYGYAVSGDKRQALTVLNKLRQLSKRRYVPTYLESFIYIGLADKDKAIKCLEKAYAEHSYALAYVLRWHPFDYLKDDKRFSSLLRRIGLNPDA